MKGLQYFNLLGVILLIVLCIAQWQRDRRMNLEVNQLEKTGFEQQSKLSEQQRLIEGLNRELGQFKEQTMKSQAELSETRQRFRAAEIEVRQLTAERNQLKSSNSNWADAVAARDERLQQANKEIRHLADELNVSIAKFNELATNYNGTVKDLNELRARLAPSDPTTK